MVSKAAVAMDAVLAVDESGKSRGGQECAHRKFYPRMRFSGRGMIKLRVG